MVQLCYTYLEVIPFPFQDPQHIHKMPETLWEVYCILNKTSINLNINITVSLWYYKKLKYNQHIEITVVARAALNWIECDSFLNEE